MCNNIADLTVTTYSKLQISNQGDQRNDLIERTSRIRNILAFSFSQTTQPQPSEANARMTSTRLIVKGVKK